MNQDSFDNYEEERAERESDYMCECCGSELESYTVSYPWGGGYDTDMHCRNIECGGE